MKERNMNRAAGIAIRAMALMMAVVMMIASAPAAIALETFRMAEDALGEQTFVLTPEAGVTVTLEGVMPIGGYADAVSADVEGEDILHAYDITIYYPDGSAFEPDDDSPISVSFKSDAIAEAEHITDGGETESVELIAAEDGEAVFEADSFSIYIIKYHDDNTDATETPRIIYHFLSPNYTQVTEGSDIYYTASAYSFPNKHNDLVTQQIVKNGESLQEVVLPENAESGLFYGWYKVHFRSETGGVYSYDWGNSIEQPERQSFNTPISVTSSTDTHVYLAPLFGHYRFLTFHQDVKGGPNQNVIIARKLVVLDSNREAVMKISDVRAPSTNPNRIVFWGWEYTHDSEGDDYDEGPEGDESTEILRTVNDDDSEIEQSITIHDDHMIVGVQPSSDDIAKMIFNIWPVFKEARWFYFDTGGNGADYVPARFVTVGEPTDYLHPLSSQIPKREGYRFTGWWCKVDLGNGETQEVRVTDNTNAFWRTELDQYDDGDGDDEVLTLNTGVCIREIDGVKQLIMDNTASEQYFYAKWAIASLANYQVIIWKQKITDDKDTLSDDKTYDYEEHDVIEYVRTN